MALLQSLAAGLAGAILAVERGGILPASLTLLPFCWVPESPFIAPEHGMIARSAGRIDFAVWTLGWLVSPVVA